MNIQNVFALAYQLNDSSKRETENKFSLTVNCLEVDMQGVVNKYAKKCSRIILHTKKH